MKYELAFDFPENVTYTQMAIYIDEHIYTEDKDVELLFCYMYHLSLMLARQQGYYLRIQDQDEFAVYCASRLYMRYVNPLQHEVTKSGEPRMKKIKSVLNYLKKVIYPYKVDYDVIFRFEGNELEVLPVGNFDLGSHMVSDTTLFDYVEFPLTLQSVPKIVKSYLERIPKKKNSSEWENIYLSCLLTLLNSMTPSQRDLKHRRAPTVEDLDKIYKELRYDDPVVFHLDYSMKDYIRVLTNQLRQVLAFEISWKEHVVISQEETMKSLLCAAFEDND